MKRFLFWLLTLSTALLRGQAPLQTLFSSNNQGSAGGMVYFDLEVQTAAGVSITRLDVNVAAPATELEVYVVAGGRSGNEGSPGAWTLVARGPLQFAGVDQPSSVCLGPGFSLGQGVHGVALRGDGLVHRYTNSQTLQTFADADLQLTAGAASNQPFGGAQYEPRVWNGAVHYQLGAGGAGTCAWTSRFGDGCYLGSTTFYEQFADLSGFDLSGTAATPYVLAATPAGSLGYVVAPGSPQWFTPQGTAVVNNQGAQLTDDDVSEPLALPFAFAFPGGATSVIHATANGEIYLAATTATTSDVTPSGVELTLAEPRVAVLWADLDPAANLAFNSASGVFFDVDATGTAAYVTWVDVADGRGGQPPGGTTSVTAQCVLRADGSFELRYGSLQPGPGIGRAVVGFGPGGQVPDPGSRDLGQSVPFATDGPDRLPLEHACTPPSLGGQMLLQVANVESATFAYVMLGTASFSPGVDLAGIGAAGCRAYTVPMTGLLVPVTQPAGVGGFVLNVPPSSGLLGAMFASQAVAPSNSNALTLTTSNGVRWMIGN